MFDAHGLVLHLSQEPSEVSRQSLGRIERPVAVKQQVVSLILSNARVLPCQAIGANSVDIVLSDEISFAKVVVLLGARNRHHDIE